MSRWSYAAADNGIVNNAALEVKAAPPTGTVNQITRMDVINVHATVATEFLILSGATVIWRTHLRPVMLTPLTITFDPPLRGAAGAAINVQCETTGASVFTNLQGDVAP